MPSDRATSRAPAAVPTLAAAVLRTGAWLYGGLWVIVAATTPWGPPGLLPVALLAPLAPLVLLATVRSLARRPPPAPTAEPSGTRAAAVSARAQAFLSAPLTPPVDRSGHPAPERAGPALRPSRALPSRRCPPAASR